MWCHYLANGVVWVLDYYVVSFSFGMEYFIAHVRHSCMGYAQVLTLLLDGYGETAIMTILYFIYVCAIIVED